MIDRSAFLSDVGTAAAKLSPPAIVVGASAAKWGVQEWMYAATIGYVVLQAAHLGWKWLREWRATRSVA
jgi:hypothetical protein